MELYRYRPKDNRTPVKHPVIGYLEWDGIYNHPDCAGHPDFELVQPEPEPEVEADNGGDEGEQPEDPPENEAGAEEPTEPADKPPAQSKAGAGKTGRSK